MRNRPKGLVYKIVKQNKGWFKKGRKPSSEEMQKVLASREGYKHSSRTKEKISSSIKKIWESGKMKGVFPKGENHHWWKNGASNFCSLIENSSEYRTWRKEVFLRDGRKCTQCKSNDRINAHHIKALSVLYQDFLKQYNQFSPIEDKEILIRLAQSYKPFWDINNGLTLCEECHKKTDTFGAKCYWKEKHGIH